MSAPRSRRKRLVRPPGPRMHWRAHEGVVIATWELADYVNAQLPQLRAQLQGDPQTSGLWILDGDVVAAFMKLLARKRVVVVDQRDAPQWGKLGVLDCWFASAEVADAVRVPPSKAHRDVVRQAERARARRAARVSSPAAP